MRFIISHSVTLIIPIFLIVLTVYSSLIGLLTEEVEKSTLNNLSQTMDNIEMKIKEISYIAVQLQENTKIKPIFFPKRKNALSAIDYFEINKELNNYKATNAFFDGISIYVSGEDMIVGTDGKADYSTFYNSVWDNSLVSELDFRNIMLDIPEGSAKIIEIARTNNIGKSLIVYLRALPILYENYKTFMIVTMDSYPVNKLLKNALGDYVGAAYILDENDKIITSSSNGSNNIDINQILPFPEDMNKSVHNARINNKDMIVLYIRSSSLEWSYIAVIPDYQILEKINIIKLWSILKIFLVSVIGVFLAYYFSFKSYFPIKKLVDTFFTGQVNKKENKNELDIIDNVLSTNMSKNNMLQKRLDQNMPFIRSDFLIRTLRGELTAKDEVMEMARFTGMKLFSGPCAVMVFHIDDYDEFVESHSEAMQNVYKFSITNVVEELCEPIGQGFTVKDEVDSVVLIINFFEGGGEKQDEIKKIGETVIRFFKEHFDFNLTAGVGQVYSQLMDIPKSYIEAQTAIDYKMIKGKNTVIFFDDIGENKTKSKRYLYPIQYETKIINCLKIFDYVGIEKVLDHIFESDRLKNISIDMAKCIYFDVINTAMKALAELGSEEYNEIVQREFLLRDFFKCETLDEVYEQTKAFYKLVCNRLRTTNDARNHEFRDRVLNYINSNFADSNLSLTLLSEKFGVSSSYMSRFVKKYTRSNFVDFIHVLRLNKAKKLLGEENKLIEDIGEECGYLDKHTFIKVFKKYHGITPGKYREVYSQKQSK